MTPIPVADSLSNREEHIVELARRIGKGRKRDLFAAVYKGAKQAKTVTELAKTLGLTEMQVLQAGVELVNAHAIDQTKVKGRVAYAKIPAHKAIRDKILKIAGDRAKIDKIPTKRRPAISGELFVAPTRSKTTSPSPKRKSSSRAQAKVAFLLASPHGQDQLNVGMEFREADSAVKASADRDKLDLRPFLAATPGTLLDALNEYRPDIIHFSGHGGGGSLVFDEDGVRSVGGFGLDFKIAHRMVKATDTPPKLLVLSACSTVAGANVFLDTVPVVIAMSDTVSDWAATYFSRRFYAALVAGQSVQAAFDQAKAYLHAEHLQDADLPTLLVATGFNASALKFVS